MFLNGINANRVREVDPQLVSNSSSKGIGTVSIFENKSSAKSGAETEIKQVSRNEYSKYVEQEIKRLEKMNTEMNVKMSEAELKELALSNISQKYCAISGDDVRSVLLEKIENDAKNLKLASGLTSRSSKIRVLIMQSAMDLVYQEEKTNLTFDDIRPYVEYSDRIENLCNAFTFLDIMDNYKKIGNKINFTFDKNGSINLEEFLQDRIFNDALFDYSDGEEILNKDFLEWKKELNLNFTKEDVETILFAIYARGQELQVEEKDGEVVEIKDGNRIVQTWADGYRIKEEVNGELVFEDKRDADGTGELFEFKDGNKIIQMWEKDEIIKETINGELVYENKVINGNGEIYYKDIKTGKVTIEKYINGKIVE